MASYITVADVDSILGPAWAPDEDKAEAVFEANAYMTSLNLVGIDMDDIPDEVKQAGARLAKCASQGKLYQQQTEGSLEAKTVKAGSVSDARRSEDKEASRLLSWASRKRTEGRHDLVRPAGAHAEFAYELPGAYHYRLGHSWR